MRRFQLHLVAAAAALLLVGVSERTSATTAQKLKVFVSIPPQAYFVERVGGACVDVEVLVGPGQSPHTYEPTAKQMVRLGDAQVYFRIGVEFENGLVPRIRRMAENLRIVDLREGVPLREMERDEHHDHHHHEDDSGRHDEHCQKKGRDPHIWLSPRNVKIVAQTICTALVELDPSHAADYRRNLAAFHDDLDRLHKEIATALAPVKGGKILVFHPAFGYFADEFELHQVPVEVEGKQPTARQLVKLIDRAKAENVKVIFVQPQFSKKSAQVIANEIGGTVVLLDPLAREYLDNLREMARSIKAGLVEPQARGEHADG